MKQPSAVARIKDPDKRMRAAAALMAEAATVAENARVRRDAIALALHRNGHEPVFIYRDVVGISRSMFNRITTRDAERDVSDVQAEARKDHAKIVAEGQALAATITHARRVEAKVLAIRDEAALALLDRNVPNADIARATGLSTARVAQLRVGV